MRDLLSAESRLKSFFTRPTQAVEAPENPKEKKGGALILTRRVGESIIIDNDIMITVLGVRGNQVRLGTNAPRSIAVDREEIHKRKLEEKMGVARC